MVVSKQKEIKETVSKADYDKLQKQVIALQKQLQPDAKREKKRVEDEMDEDDDLNDIVISSDAYIKVMSLTPYLLTLTTEEYGRGKRFDFHKFGEVKNILYHHLCDIMEIHPNFVDEGYFVVLNKNVVRKHGLDEKYAKILTKEKLEQIFSGNQSDAANLFKSCGDTQRGFIINMIHDKMLAGEEVDLNLLDRLSRIVDPTGKYSIAKVGEEMIEDQKIKTGK